MLEKAWYEMSPAVYMIASCLIIFNTNRIAAFFASLLLLVSLLIGFMWIQFRTNPKMRLKKAKQASGYRL
ncbi:MAG: hypothetical protein FJ190_00360 [Gammaproteobacteria bacterium]|nr:hypothetical protein [Gammaproteobacteria bacterium]